MRILQINQDWFKSYLRASGHTVVTAGFSGHLDWQPPTPIVSLDQTIRECMDGIPPDVILILDNSAPIWLMGLNETNIPVVFYSVDTHHLAILHTFLGLVFDYLLVAQQDFVDQMSAVTEAPIEWMPLWASSYVDTCEQKQYDAVFVGSLKPELNPRRVAFFKQLTTIVPVQFFEGTWQQYFPKSEVVINQTVRGDLNFRVFEAMVSGTMLLTERISNGLFDLFQEGQHLVTYMQNDVHSAAEQIKYYLEHGAAAAEIARNGRVEILARHLEEHRAEKILRVCQQVAGSKARRRKANLGWMANCNELAVKLANSAPEFAPLAIRFALRAAEMAINSGERIELRLSYPFVGTCLFYGILTGADEGLRLLERVAGSQPDLLLVRYGLLREYLNRNCQDQARDLANSINPTGAITETYELAEKIVSDLMADYMRCIEDPYHHHREYTR